jgi:hypothetical protein
VDKKLSSLAFCILRDLHWKILCTILFPRQVICEVSGSQGDEKKTYSSKILVPVYQTTWHHIPGDHHLLPSELLNLTGRNKAADKSMNCCLCAVYLTKIYTKMSKWRHQTNLYKYNPFLSIYLMHSNSVTVNIIHNAFSKEIFI